MLSAAEKLALFKRIRELEREFYPNHEGEILSTKAVDGIIHVATAQKTLHKEGWLEKYVKTIAENHIRSAQQAKSLIIKNKNLPKGQKLTNQVDKYGPPRKLKPGSCFHIMKIRFSRMPDYQDQREYVRMAFLILGFEYEVRLGRNQFFDFQRKIKFARKWDAEIEGEVTEETEHGFLIPNGKLKSLLADRKMIIGQASSQPQPPAENSESVAAQGI